MVREQLRVKDVDQIGEYEVRVRHTGFPVVIPTVLVDSSNVVIHTIGLVGLEEGITLV